MSARGAGLLLLCALLAGCGQTGPLYLPEEGGEVVTRPTQTRSPAPAPQPAPQVPPQAPPQG